MVKPFIQYYIYIQILQLYYHNVILCALCFQNWLLVKLCVGTPKKGDA